MDGGGQRRPPYLAVCFLLIWAELQWTTLDGVLQQKQIDIYERQRGPLFRFVALLHSMYVIDVLPWIDDEDAKKTAEQLLEWPAIYAQKQMDESTRAAVASLEAAGFDPQHVFRRLQDAHGTETTGPQ